MYLGKCSKCNFIGHVVKHKPNQYGCSCFVYQFKGTLCTGGVLLVDSDYFEKEDK